MVPTPPLFLMWIKTNRCLVRIDDPYLIDVSSSKYKSIYILYKGDKTKDKDSTVYTAEYRSKRNPTVKPRWA